MRKQWYRNQETMPLLCKGEESYGRTIQKGAEEGGFMIKIATFIVDRRNLFFLLFGIALIFSVVSMNWVAVENALSAYLPDTTETSQGLERMEEQFITYGTAKVMVTNIPYEEADKIYQELQELDSIIMLDLTIPNNIITTFRRCTVLHLVMRRRMTERWKRWMRFGVYWKDMIFTSRLQWVMRQRNSWQKRCL